MSSFTSINSFSTSSHDVVVKSSAYPTAETAVVAVGVGRFIRSAVSTPRSLSSFLPEGFVLIESQDAYYDSIIRTHDCPGV
jgi:hypothetical protein